MTRTWMLGAAVCGAVQLTIGVTAAHAQLHTQHIKRTIGLKGGSQPPPGIYVIAPLIYLYSTDSVRDGDGKKLPGNATINSLAAAGGFSVVTTKKILSGHYGFQMLFPAFIDNAIQGAHLDTG